MIERASDLSLRKCCSSKTAPVTFASREKAFQDANASVDAARGERRHRGHGVPQARGAAHRARLVRISSCWTSTCPGWTAARSSQSSRRTTSCKTIPTDRPDRFGRGCRHRPLRATSSRRTATSASPCSWTPSESLVQSINDVLAEYARLPRAGAAQMSTNTINDACSWSKTTRETLVCSARCSTSGTRTTPT